MTAASETSRAPYKLFDYYEYKDRDLFFGREAEVLRTVGEVLSTRLLVLFAPSGSGKSSLINAGVRPKLEERGFATVTVRLDSVPDLAIKRQLRAKLPEVFAGLSDDTDLVAGLRTAYASKDGLPVPKPLVLFLDQFEEFFIVFRDKPDLRRAFINQIAEIKFDASLPVYLVLSLRDDYFVRMNEFREEIPSIFHNNANIELRPMDDEAALRAIVEPAKKVGLDYEPGLPERIIHDLKALNSHSSADTNASEDGVQPISLQIVCYNLWAKLPQGARLIAKKLYAGRKEEGGLGGAAAIISRQLDESLRKIPKSEYDLMRKLFRVLMTDDLTKRLRSIDDLAKILGLRDREKLTELLKHLTAASVLREERSEGRPWYEFRHDYLVKEVAVWLERLDAQRRRQRAACSGAVASIPAIVLIGLAWFYFESFRLRLIKLDGFYEQQLVIVRAFNPLGLQINTGLGTNLDFTEKEAYENELWGGGLSLPIGSTTRWRPLINLIQRSGRGAFILFALNVPERIPLLLTNDLAQVVEVARVDPELGKGLIALLKDASVNVRLSAAEALVTLGKGDAPVVEGLLALLKDNDWTVRQSAAEALGKPGKGDAPVVEGLLALLKDSDRDVRQSAAEALGKLGKGDAPVVEGLLALLKDNDWTVRQSAAEALGKLGKGDAPVVEGLLALLKDSDRYVRLSAAEALVTLGKGDARVVEGLLALLKDNDSSVRLRAAEALVTLGKGDAPVVEGLLALLKDSDRYVRQSAAEALVTLGKGDAPVVEGLLALLKDNDWTVRRSAAEALVTLGKGDAPVVEGLLALLKDSDRYVRLSAAEALVTLGKGDAPVVEGLLALLKDSDRDVRLSAAEALGKLGKGDAPVVEGLLALLKDRHSYVVEGAAKALARLGKLGQEHTGWNDDHLLEMLQDNLLNKRQTAAHVLANLPNLSPSSYAKVMALRNDPRPWVRISAWDALLEIQDVRETRESEAKEAQKTASAASSK